MNGLFSLRTRHSNSPHSAAASSSNHHPEALRKPSASDPGRRTSVRSPAKWCHRKSAGHSSGSFPSWAAERHVGKHNGHHLQRDHASTTARYAHVVHSHFAFMVRSCHCIALSITTPIGDARASPPTPTRTCSGPPKSSRPRGPAPPLPTARRPCVPRRRPADARATPAVHAGRRLLGPPMLRQT